tara:strand:- start:141 stop:425 length:285 start_codon:yes stop_codon:yes gene_type:complete
MKDKKDEFYRLELEGEEFFDNDHYSSVLEAFEDIPSRTREWIDLGNNFKPDKVGNKTYIKYWVITYNIENPDKWDDYYEKRVLRINAQKLLWKP